MANTGRSLALAAALTALSFAPAAAQSKPLIPSADLNEDGNLAVLPLQQGFMDAGQPVWFVILDASDRDTAERLGVNFSNKLGNAAGPAVRDARIGPRGGLIFEMGAVDFTPERIVEPGGPDNPLPLKTAQPGSVGDADYSPLVRVWGDGGTVFNAPVLAFNVAAEVLDQFCDGSPDYALVHDRVASICPRDGIVTLKLTDGFSAGREVNYVSTEADVAEVAALEAATHAPRLDRVPAQSDEAPFSAVEPIYVVINGVRGRQNGVRQGIESAVLDGLSPRNITGDIPGEGHGYSPLWASHPVFWSADALDKRELLSSETQVLGAAATGLLTGFDNGPVQTDGVIVNCPVIAREPEEE